MPTTFTDVDLLILQRWDDARGFLEAYEELQDRMHDLIQEVGERLEQWAESRACTVEVDAKTPQYCVYKTAWMNRRKDDALVYYSLLDFAPVGYRRVKEAHPSIWVHTDNLNMLKLKEPERIQFARALRNRLGDTAKSWQHAEVKDAEYPLGKALTQISDTDRVQMVADPERLFGFAVATFEEAFALSDAIDQTLAEFRPRE
jgi:hypothetical protein